MNEVKRYLTANAFRMALEERLRQTATVKGEAWLFQQRKLLTFDRLLARLLVAAPDNWILNLVFGNTRATMHRRPGDSFVIMSGSHQAALAAATGAFTFGCRNT